MRGISGYIGLRRRQSRLRRLSPCWVKQTILSGSILLLQLAVGESAFSVTLEQYLAIRGPAPDATLHYGAAPSQVVELFLPKGPGPFPVAILIHGGCWQSRYQGLEQFRVIAAELAKQGIAVWNVEYRRVDEAGGGYPGMYQDIGAAIDTVDTHAADYRLDKNRVVAIGHSAGAQLALWGAARAHLPHTSPLYVRHPLPIGKVVTLGSLANLANDAAAIRQACGIDPTALTGTQSPARPDVFSDTSPAALLPNATSVVAITGSHDTIAPPEVVRDYVALAQQSGDPARFMVVPGATHLDEVVIDSPVWPILDNAIHAALGMQAP